ncbi:MAG TPA: condensation domain-containing protein, partial [Polyangiaceae bacterium]|nr:condensation domain-containing protein [Polyangiaceae bacterium]
GLKVLVGGEPVDPALWAALGAAERLEAYNLYGPTECTVDATAARVRAGTRPSLGRALGGVRLYALDARGEPAPPGAPAELHIGGVGVALGYVGRAGLTAERFVPDPFAGEPGARLYRTGDRVRLRPDGELEFLGRLDRQIKLRGVRIELGEVEAALGEIDGVAAAAAALREGAGGEARLVAYVVARDGRALDPGALREALVRRLPASMVPSVFVPLDALPRTPQGKLDRDALPPPEPPAADAGREGGEPRGATEAALASIWGELLGREGLGREANFFELGGHSLLATRVLARVRSSLGAELPLRAIFEAPTLAALAARIDAAAPSAPPEPAPRRRAPEEEPALSFAQRRLWFLDQLTPGDPAYNLPMALRLTGELDAGALADALAALARRHEALRTTFDERDGLPVARVHGEDFVPPLRAIDLRAHDETGRERALAELAADEAARPFDLREGPLVRAALARLGGREHALFLTAHHAVTDGWSGGILAREFALLYEAIARGEAPRLPELPLQYADYAAWQRERLEGPWLRGELDHWRRALEGAPRLELPADRRPPPGAASRRAGTVALTLAPPLAGRLRALAAEEGCTPFMALLAGFQALLARYTGQGDLSVGTPVAGRTRLELEGLVGLFVNTLVLRTRVEAARSFRALLGRARETCLEAFAHQELPFERLVEELRPERDLSGTPLFRVFFALQNVPRAEVTLGGLTFAPLGLPTAAAKFDLSLRLEERGDAIEGELEYRADLFDRATAERLARHLVALLSAALDRPDAPLDRLPLLDDGERRLLLEAGAGGPRAAWGTLAEAFTAQVARAPAALALAFVGRELSFAELDARSNQIARALRRRGVGPDTPVGLCLPRSLELVVAVWGVLKAGGAYVPLDPEYPAKRLAFIARDARLGLVLCARTTAALVAGADAFALDPGEPVWAEPTDPLPASGASADSLAYILYTSGSTGSPKGVAVRQGAVRNLVAALRGPLGLGARPLRFSLNGPLAFDTSVKQLFQLLDGHALDVTPDEVRYDADALIDYLERQQVDVFDCTPTHLRALLAAGLGGRARPGLKVLVGGEPVDPAL